MSDSSLFIAVISLKTAPERRVFFEEGWKDKLGDGSFLGTKVHYHEADPDPESGVLGCTRSHMAVYKKALDAGKKAALVFEDDVRINSLFKEQTIKDLVQLLKFWDVIRLHKTGVCKLHGRLSSNVFHASSLCGRAYLISQPLMEYVLKFDSKEVVPYTYFLAKSSARQLTYHPTLIQEGAFGSWNSAGFGDSKGGSKSQFNPMTILQWTLNHTVVVEQAVANVSWYGNLTSPLFTEEKFPEASGFSSKARPNEKMALEQYIKDVGPYDQDASMVQEVGYRLEGSGKEPVILGALCPSYREKLGIKNSDVVLQDDSFKWKAVLKIGSVLVILLAILIFRSR